MFDIGGWSIFCLISVRPISEKGKYSSDSMFDNLSKLADRLLILYNLSKKKIDHSVDTRWCHNYYENHEYYINIYILSKSVRCGMLLGEVILKDGS